MKPVRLQIAGLFGSPNFGNEATLGAFLHNVTTRLPTVALGCAVAPNARASEMYGLPQVALDLKPTQDHFWRLRPPALRSWLHDLVRRATERGRQRLTDAHMRGSTALVLPGTGLFDDFGQGPLDLPSHLNRWTKAARAQGARVDIVSVGVSTVRNRESRRLLGAALGRADYCSFRDEESQHHARGLGCLAGAVVPDLAFSLPEEMLPQVPPSADRVGFGLMGYYGWNKSGQEAAAVHDRYVDKVVSVVSTQLAIGREVLLFTGDARADARICQEVVSRCEGLGMNTKHLRDASVNDFHDTLLAIASSGAVVATRFHNVLFALLLGRPVISIGYADKNDALMRSFGLERYRHAIDDFDPPAISAQIEECLEEDSRLALGMRDVVADARLRLARQYDELCDAWSS